MIGLEAGHKGLQVYSLAHELAIKVHRMTLSLARFETHEEGSQIRRSSKSISANLVEGYALRKYKSEYLHYLYLAYASCKETEEHLEYLWETGSLQDQRIYEELKEGYRELNAKLFQFIRSVEREHGAPFFLKEEQKEYGFQGDASDDED